MKSKISYYRQNQSGFLSLKSSLFTAGVILATASVGTAVVAQTMTVPSSNINASSGTGFCVTAELEDDPSIFAQRGNCGPEGSEPGVGNPGDPVPEDGISPYCTPALLEAVRIDSEAFVDVRYIEYQKYMNDHPYDAAILKDYFSNGPDLPDINAMTAEEVTTFYDANAYVLAQGHEMAKAYPAQPVGLLPVEILTKMPEVSKTAMAEFCLTYKGPISEVKSEPRYENSWEPTKLHGSTGSTDPIVLRYSMDFGNANDFKSTVVGAESIPGYASNKTETETVGDKTIFKVSLIPAASGWIASNEVFDISVSVDRKQSSGYSRPMTLAAQIRINDSVLKIVPNPQQAGVVEYHDTAPGYGSTWDNHTTHVGSSQIRKGDTFGFSLERDGNDTTPSYYDVRSILTESTGSSLTTNAVYDDWGVGLASFRFNDVNIPSTAKLKMIVVDPETFAQAEHVFTRSLTTAKTGEKPHSISIESEEVYDETSINTISIDDGYLGWDYDISMTYNGETCTSKFAQGYCMVPITLSDGSSGYLNLNTRDPNLRQLRLIAIVDDSLPDEVEVKLTYRMTGESTITKINIK